MADTYLQWGGLRHPDWEMNLASYVARARLSPRGRVVSYIYTMQLEGQIQATGAAAINARLQGIITAYHTQNQDARFYVDGVLTPHQLINNLSSTGNKVVQFGHPRGDAAEYANKRTLSVIIQGEYLDPESQLYDWQETIRWVGDTGPRAEWVQHFQGVELQEVCQATSMRIQQRGRATGILGYVLPPGPAWPGIEHRPYRVIDVGAPKFLGQIHGLYQSEWSYEMETDAYTETFPTPR